MADCVTGQLPYLVSITGKVGTGNTPQQACSAAWLNYAPRTGVAVTATRCEETGQSWNWFQIIKACDVPTTPPPEPPASAASGTSSATAPACTASSPCVMNVTAEQMQKFEGWLLLVLVCALVFASLHGYSQGQKR